MQAHGARRNPARGGDADVVDWKNTAVSSNWKSKGRPVVVWNQVLWW